MFKLYLLALITLFHSTSMTYIDLDKETNTRIYPDFKDEAKITAIINSRHEALLACLAESIPNNSIEIDRRCFRSLYATEKLRDYLNLMKSQNTRFSIEEIDKIFNK